MDIFPAGLLLRELVLAIGAALVVGNVAVLVRERRRTPQDTRPKPSMPVLALNLVVGSLLTLWAAASLIAG